MKIIKNTIILAAAALMMGAVSSCSDYLDKTPEARCLTHRSTMPT